MQFRQLALLCLPLAVALNANAEPPPPAEGQSNVVAFTAEVTKEVDYDVMEATLFVKEENKNLKELNQSINEKVNAALAIIKKQSAVEIKKNLRNSQVRYDSKGKQSGWIERADLVLESKDFVALSQVISELNDTFAIAFVNPKLSKETAAKFEEEMIKSALAEFQHKAQLIQTSLNAKGYKIVNLRLESMDRLPPELGFRNMRPMAEMASFSKSSDDVNLENDDKAELRATVSAQIELLN